MERFRLTAWSLWLCIYCFAALNAAAESRLEQLWSTYTKERARGLLILAKQHAEDLNEMKDERLLARDLKRANAIEKHITRHSDTLAGLESITAGQVAPAPVGDPPQSAGFNRINTLLSQHHKRVTEGIVKLNHRYLILFELEKDVRMAAKDLPGANAADAKVNWLKSATHRLAAPPGAQEFNGHYYKLVEQKPTNWKKAKRACEELGGHLVTITSKEELDWLGKTYGSNLRKCAIGLTDEKRERRWVWVTGEDIPDYNWQPGQPTISREQNYAGININLSWFDNDADSFWGYICEWE